MDMDDGLVPLLRLLIAAGGPRSFDAREQWPLHRCLTILASRLNSLEPSFIAGMPDLSFKPDPDVGMRAAGVTRALWNLTAAGDLSVVAQHGRTQFSVEPTWLSAAHSDLMQLKQPVADAIYVAATCW